MTLKIFALFHSTSLALISALIIFDQITKLIFSHRDFFIGPLHVHEVKNYGLVFSFNFGLLVNLILIGFGLFFFVYYYRKRDLAFILILAGAISNVIDRLRLGYVRDFLGLSLGFTFNFSDVFITFGIILILFTQSIRNDIIDI